MTQYLKIGLGFERMFFFILVFFLTVHIGACLWLIVAGIYNPHTSDSNDNTEIDYKGTWLEEMNSKNNFSTTDQYVLAVYWTVTTITTVGYGDISATKTNNLEMLFCSGAMIIGVIAFSFANGSLSSIISEYDSTNANLQQKLVILNKIYKEFGLPLDLFIRIKKCLGYDSKNDMHELHDFLEELPYKLRTEVSLYVYEERYKKIKYLWDRNLNFILWLCPLMKPQVYDENSFIYLENEKVNEIYFLTSGIAAFVLPRYRNSQYITITEGSHVGVIDIIASLKFNDIPYEQWFEKKALLNRHFFI